MSRIAKQGAVFLYSMLLVGCGGVIDEYGRWYATAEESSKVIHIEVDKLVVDTEPLPAPLAGSAKIVLPPRDHFLKIVRRYNPTAPDKLRQGDAADIAFQFETIPVLLEKRNVFTDLTVVRSLSAPEVQSKEHLIQYTFDLSWVHVLVRRPGSIQAIELPRPWNETTIENAYEANRLVLKTVEDFVRQDPG